MEFSSAAEPGRHDAPGSNEQPTELLLYREPGVPWGLSSGQLLLCVGKQMGCMVLSKTWLKEYCESKFTSSDVSVQSINIPAFLRG